MSIRISKIGRSLRPSVLVHRKIKKENAIIEPDSQQHRDLRFKAAKLIAEAGLTQADLAVADGRPGSRSIVSNVMIRGARQSGWDRLFEIIDKATKTKNQKK